VDVGRHGEVIPATAIARAGHAVLLRGASGLGKSDLALRSICGACRLPGEDLSLPFELISDDQTILKRVGSVVYASAPLTISGLLEVRGIGILPFPSIADVPVALVVELTQGPVERMPENPGQMIDLLGVPIASARIVSFESSAPIKLAIALNRAVAAQAAVSQAQEP
jgi:serine kinase of HPr protein (carbohydrate metabolism regulator)